MSIKNVGQFGGARRYGGDATMRIVLIAGLAFVCLSSVALFVIFTFSDYSEAHNDTPIVVEKEAKLETVEVLVPVQAITGGSSLEPSQFRIETRPKVGISDRIVRDLEEIKGMYAMTLILPGQPLYKDYLTNVRPVNQITAKIPPGFRAVTIRVDVKSSIEGWARAGARVDVAWNTTIRGRRAVQIIVENALVISAARQLESHGSQQPSAEVPSELTLMVTNEDAKKIMLASGTGSLSLSLRGDRDAGKAEAGVAITEDDLLGISKTDQESKRPESIVKIRDENGNFAEFVLHNGQLVPYLGGM
ncbi:MAG: Flp pilus assembly protein CpaB [Deltaproteobacteria bacterium]|nr:Flp pilus assembly protein CpaB [Deltaproteobacteria bacterium]